jgi:uncharacterized protein HemX
MSQTAIAGRIPTRPALRAPVRPQPAAPRLRVVAPPARVRHRAGVTVLCLVLLAAGLVGLLVLNINLSHGSYTLNDLQLQQTQLEEQQEALQEELDSLQTPQNLARQAQGLGMVPAPRPAFMRLGTGQVVGAPAAASTPPPPRLLSKP